MEFSKFSGLTFLPKNRRRDIPIEFTALKHLQDIIGREKMCMRYTASGAVHCLFATHAIDITVLLLNRSPCPLHKAR